MPATIFTDLPINADRQRPWDADTAEQNVREWAGGSDIDWRKYAQAFAWVDSVSPDEFGSYKLPFADVIDGTLQVVPRGVFAAAAAINGSQGGVSLPAADVGVVKELLTKYYTKMAKKFGDDSIHPPWNSRSEPGSDLVVMRADPEGARRDRIFAIRDASVREDGAGRTVDAYCAAFNAPAEIHDQDGHYNEVMSPGSFDRTIAHNGTRFGVFYNHARTIYGTPDGALSVPIGVPVEAPRADSHGVMTVTRYLDDNPLADAVLSAIKQGAIAGQSFSGRFMKSTRTRASTSGGLPTIARNEVAMREYGPTPFPAYVEAKITGTRSADAYLHDLIAMDRDERADLFSRMLALATPLGATDAQEPAREVIVVMPKRADLVEQPDARADSASTETIHDSSDTADQAPVEEQATSTPEPGQEPAEDSPARHSVRQTDIAHRARAARISRTPLEALQ